MIPLTPALLLAAASALVDEDHDRPAHHHTPTTFVHHAGFWSHWDHRAARSSWPLDPADDPTELATLAARHRILVTDCAAGDIFLAWSALHRRFEHAGIVCTIRGVVRPPLRAEGVAVDCLVIECTARGAVQRHLRRLSPRAGDRFVRWTDLDARVALDHALVVARRLRSAA